MISRRRYTTDWWRRRFVLPAIAGVLALLEPLHAAPAHNFLWKATGKQGVIYLLGSVHVLSKDYYPLDPALETSFKDADLLVEEVDLADMLAPEAQMQMLTRGSLPAGQTLDKLLSPSTLALVNKTLADVPAGELLKRFKPWMLALTIQALELQKGGFDPSLGLDKHFYDLAQEARKEVQGLETVEYQLSRFDEMTPEQQDRLLAEAVKELATEKANVGKLADAWKAGDAATVERIVLADLKSDPVIYRRLLVERNQNWLPKLEALFTRRGHAFVVVGAAHLVGPDGLLAMLKAKGYTVEQM
jgi:uncharacterized protein YbaP (TraB family)